MNKQKQVFDGILGLLPSMDRRKRPITSNTMMRLIGATPRGTNYRLRKACKVLLRDHGIPIILSRKGFFVAKTKEELRRYRRSLLGRAEKLIEDAQAIDRICANFRSARKKVQNAGTIT